MIDDSVFNFLDRKGLREWIPTCKQLITERLSDQSHGDFSRWKDALNELPHDLGSAVHCDRNAVTVELNQQPPKQLQNTLEQLIPWRKGPFQIGDVYIDTEWHSDYKWNRLIPHTNFSDKNILDVGCGNGYFMWRMLGAGARNVLGIDPSILFSVQFQAIKRFFNEEPNAWLLPVGIESFPNNNQAFDTVLSMGVLYHRRSPMDHLLELKGCLKPGGELLLETLTIDGDAGQALVPDDRYAQMRNVWFLPTVAELERWLARCGYKNIRCVDVNQTTTEEQRATDWMRFDSLPQFLDPKDSNKTIEGYPAPKRAIILANC